MPKQVVYERYGLAGTFTIEFGPETDHANGPYALCLDGEQVESFQTKDEARAYIRGHQRGFKSNDD